MRRRCRQIGIGLCLLLAIAAAAGYLLDRDSYCAMSIVIAGDCWEVGSGDHDVIIRYSRQVCVLPGFATWAAWAHSFPHPIDYCSAVHHYVKPPGFYLDHGDWVSTPEYGVHRNIYWEAGAPLWLFAVLAILPPAAAFYKTWRRRRRAVVGCCRVCGYDLRASPERCPECGTPTAPTVPIT